MNNDQIAKSLEQLADLLEFTGSNPFRLRAYRNGARVVRDLPQSVASLIESGADLTKLDGIGKGVAEKCHELIDSGRLSQMDEILETVPKTVLDLLNVPGLGPKKAATLYNELNIENLDMLKAACEANQVQTLPKFGAKTEQAILDGIAIAAASNERILWASADKLVARLREHMDGCPVVERLEFAGSYRRGKETVGDLDLLVDSQDASAVMDHFGEFSEISSVIARGDTKMSVRLENEFQIDLRVVPADSFGAALQYFTGSKDHNVQVRGRAKKMGLRINEWGVFRTEVDGRAIENADEQPAIAGKTEQDVYAALGMPLFEPELREARNEFEQAESGSLPKLIVGEDMQGDLHMHTVATDGKNTIEEMVVGAKERGLNYIAITDHSKRVTMANGLDRDRLLDQWKSIDAFNKAADDDFLVLKGIECDILENGDMDLPDDVLAKADWVVASVHYGQKQPRDQITDRIIGAIENPHVSMIAHPTGRLINKRKPYEVDMDAVFQAAAEHGKLLELNSNPRRLDLHDAHLMAAKKLGIPIVINTDAHRIAGLDDIRFGIKQARRGGLCADDVANTRSWKAMKSLIGR
jgi:DNA polymerase (family 10)